MTPGSEPAFVEPWHARAFALAVAENEADRLSWPDWTARLAKTLRRSGISQALNGGDDYFLAWLETLESILVEEGRIERGEIELAMAELAKAHGNARHEPRNGQPAASPD
ncbi:MAG: nitrile hydratase accessory protein [Boseongicola sp. SB0676_bin_33]|uniref:Nitrile hydratase accessory protein n=1 Tax=Boseongicola sp. SB0664_bin_43 TaxID=2604844 RepID=A0A6B0Y0K1_9RHOB|nr:nitrile hydratase accessory protein [Boseongicola sp. SB0664_bin_43]MYF89616.1 nitrile hydratase accessory protein [Boseongicola sp. SB0676_bin_33]MYK30916.1 nitrile hydratase accessory protein [Boseongicola sp. SB0670_bin_30]